MRRGALGLHRGGGVALAGPGQPWLSPRRGSGEGRDLGGCLAPPSLLVWQGANKDSPAGLAEQSQRKPGGVHSQTMRSLKRNDLGFICKTGPRYPAPSAGQ